MTNKYCKKIHLFACIPNQMNITTQNLHTEQNAQHLIRIDQKH
jgi:hypothetical protein